MKQLLPIVGFCFLFFVFTGCNSSKTNNDEIVVKTATRFFGEFQNLGIIENDSYFVLNSVLSQLVTFSSEGKIKGDLAERWSVSDNQRIYDFFLRKNATFSNGEAVTVRHVLFAFERFLASKGANAEYLRSALSLTKGQNQGLQVISPWQLRVHFKRPMPRFLQFIAYDLGLAVVHPLMVKKKSSNGSDTLDIGKPSAGLYRVVSENTDRIDLELREKHYFARTTLPKRIAILNRKKADASAEMLKNNINLLFIGGAVPDELGAVAAQKKIQIFRTNTYIVAYLRPNFFSKIYQQYPNVFRVLNRKLNRAALLSDSLAIPAGQMLPRNVFGSSLDLFAGPDENVKIGNGTKKLVPIQIGTLKGNSILKSINLSALKEQFASFGLRMNMVEMDNQAYNAAISASNPGVDLILIASVLDNPVTDILLRDLSAEYFKPSNALVKKKYEGLFAQIDKAPNESALAATIARLSAFIVNEGIFVPLFHRPIVWAAQSDVLSESFVNAGGFDFFFFHELEMKHE